MKAQKLSSCCRRGRLCYEIRLGIPCVSLFFDTSVSLLRHKNCFLQQDQVHMRIQVPKATHSQILEVLKRAVNEIKQGASTTLKISTKSKGMCSDFEPLLTYRTTTLICKPLAEPQFSPSHRKKIHHVTHLVHCYTDYCCTNCAVHQQQW